MTGASAIGGQDGTNSHFFTASMESERIVLIES